MNALKLFKNILLPHLWLSPSILPFLTAAAPIIGAGIGAFASRGSGSPGASTGFAALPTQLQESVLGGQTRATNLLEQGRGAMFPEATTAPLSQMQMTGLAQQRQAANQFANQQLPGVFGSFGTALNAGNIFQDPSVQAGLGTIESRGTQNFLENILPGLRRGQTATGGQFGTRGELAAGVAGSRMGRDIGDAQAQFLAQQLASARGLQGLALGQAPNIGQLGQLQGATTFQTGEAERANRQAQINDAIRRFEFPQQSLDQFINRLGSLGGVGGGASFSPGTSVSPLAGALGGAQLGGAIGDLFPSFTSPAPTTTFAGTGGPGDLAAAFRQQQF